MPRMNHLSQIPELQALLTPGQVVRIPDQMDVPLTDRVRRLVDTSAFGRLRHISQLGLVSVVYPGATHSRFEHSLGVYRNALLYLRHLSRFDDLVHKVDTQQAHCLIVSSLLHDLGHWPYCHPIEDLQLAGWPEHETLVRELLESEEIASLLRQDWGLGVDNVCDLLTKRTRNDGDRILSGILSGPIDVDKLDYLYRDSLHAGVPYGLQFDTSRIISNLCLNETGDGIAIAEKGRTAAELMVFARYVMFNEVYWHPAVRSATAMLQRCFYLIQNQWQAGDMLRMSDETFRRMLLKCCRGMESESLSVDLFGPRRRLYKRVAQYSLFESPAIFRLFARRPYQELLELSGRLAIQISQATGLEVAREDILLDAPPVGLEVQFRVPVQLDRTRSFRPLGDLSPVVQALATQQFDDHVKRVRVFVHPRLVSAMAELPMESLLENSLE